MDIAHSTGDYTTAVDKLISFLDREPTDPVLLTRAQGRLDQLASHYQADEQLGARRYKLYQAQAMISYLEGDRSKARQFIQESINVRGGNYTFAEEMLESLKSDRPRKSIRKWVFLIVAPFATLVIVALLQMVANFALSGASGQTSSSDYSSTQCISSDLSTISGCENQPASGPTLLKTIINIICMLLGIASVLCIMLLPVWILMLVRTITYNDHPEGGISKTAAIVLAIVFGLWTWLYTYDRDSAKFWVNLALTLITVGIWSIVAWIWAIIDTTGKPDEYYRNYPNFAR